MTETKLPKGKRFIASVGDCNWSALTLIKNNNANDFVTTDTKQKNCFMPFIAGVSEWYLPPFSRLGSYTRPHEAVRLYNISFDPTEHTSVARQHPHVTKRLLDRLHSHRTRLGFWRPAAIAWPIAILKLERHPGQLWLTRKTNKLILANCSLLPKRKEHQNYLPFKRFWPAEYTRRHVPGATFSVFCRDICSDM